MQFYILDENFDFYSPVKSMVIPDQVNQLKFYNKNDNDYLFFADPTYCDIYSYTINFDNANEDIVSTQKLSLSNYPNPFNPITTIRYSLPKDEYVTIEIYNLKGQKVKTVVKKKQKAGYYKVDWNGTNDNGKRVASGVYFYRLKTKNKNLIRKMILLK